MAEIIASGALLLVVIHVVLLASTQEEVRSKEHGAFAKTTTFWLNRVDLFLTIISPMRHAVSAYKTNVRKEKTTVYSRIVTWLAISQLLFRAVTVFINNY